MFLLTMLLGKGKPSPQSPSGSSSRSHCGCSLLLVISSFCHKPDSCQVWGFAAVGLVPPHQVLSLQWLQPQHCRLPWQPQWSLKQGPAECLTLTPFTTVCVWGWSQNSQGRSPCSMKLIILWDVQWSTVYDRWTSHLLVTAKYTCISWALKGFSACPDGSSSLTPWCVCFDVISVVSLWGRWYGPANEHEQMVKL